MPEIFNDAKVTVYVSVANQLPEGYLGSDLKLDCRKGEDGVTALLQTLEEPDRQGSPGFDDFMSDHQDQEYRIELTNIDAGVPDCVKSYPNVKWLVVLSLRSYLSLPVKLDSQNVTVSRYSLDGQTKASGHGVSTWQRKWSGFHPAAIEFVRAHWRVLDEDVNDDFRKLPGGVIHHLGSREQPTIFDRIWYDLDTESQQTIIEAVCGRKDQATLTRLAPLQDFGFYRLQGQDVRWFSPLFASYVYHYHTQRGVWWRIAHRGELLDGVIDLLSLIRAWNPDIFVVRPCLALICLTLVALISSRISNFWILMIVTSIGILLTLIALWPGLKHPHLLFSSRPDPKLSAKPPSGDQGQPGLEFKPSRLLVNFIVLVAGASYFYYMLPRYIQASSSIDQDQISLALGIIQVLPLIYVLPKPLSYASDWLERILSSNR